MKNTLVFTGGYSLTTTLGTGEVVSGKGEGIYVFRLNNETGALTKLSVLRGEPNPTFLAIDRTKRYLYAANELKSYSSLETGAFSSYAIDAENGVLSLLNRRISGGTDPAFITINDENTYALICNYMSGSSGMLPLEKDGSLGKLTCFLQHKGSSVDIVRQTGPHAHGFILDKENNRGFVPDLGTDELVVYDIDWEKGYLKTRENNPKTAPEAWAWRDMKSAPV